MLDLMKMNVSVSEKQQKKKSFFNSFQNIYFVLTLPVLFTTFLTDNDRIFYLSKVISQFALCAFLYERVEEEESHFSFMGLLALTADFISEGFAVYDNEISSELFALISAFFFSLCMCANIFDRWGYKKSWNEFYFLTFLSIIILCIQFLVQIEIEFKSKFWTTNPCLYALGFMAICQIWRYQKTSSSSLVYGLIGTLIHVLSGDMKFLFLGYWSPTMVKLVGLGELFSNYYMTISIDDHMVWRRKYTKTSLRKKNDEFIQVQAPYKTIDEQLQNIFETQ